MGDFKRGQIAVGSGFTPLQFADLSHFFTNVPGNLARIFPFEKREDFRHIKSELISTVIRD